MPSPPRSILVVAPEFAIDADGTYRPGGLALFSRCIVGSLAGAPGLERLEAWGLLDEVPGIAIFEQHFAGLTTQVRTRAFAGNRRRMALEFALRNREFDLVAFLHIGVGRLGVLRGFRPQSLWLVGIEVRRTLRWYERFPIRRSHPFPAISKFSSDEMRRFNPDLPSAVPVHLGVEPQGPWTSASAVERKESYDASKRRRAVLIVARLAAEERYKGHDQLIESWPSVLRDCPDAELWIAGAGNDEARLRAKAASMNADVAGRIRFLGRVSHERLLELYATTRVFAMPSTGEGFGLVFAEAMRFGVPCVCSYDSSAEIVLNNETGFAVPQTAHAIGAACARLLSDDDLANRMGRAGQERFHQHYTFAGMRRRVRDVYGYRTEENCP